MRDATKLTRYRYVLYRSVLCVFTLLFCLRAVPLHTQTMPDVNGNIYAIVPDNNCGIYIGGNFTAVGGVPRTGLAHIFSSGAVDMAWNPTVVAQGNLLVTTLALESSALYVGGSFVAVNGAARKNIAALNATTAALLPFTVNGYLGSQVMKLLSVNGQIYAAGYFTSIDGQVRKGLAAFHAQTGALLPFNGNLRDYFVVGSAQYDMDPLTNSLYASGTTIYIGGAFVEASGQPRKGIAAFDVASGMLLNFAPGNDMPEYMTTEILGIHQNSVVTHHYPFTLNAQTRKISAFDLLSGALQGAWNPNPNNSVFSFFGSGDVAYLGGSFTTIGGADRAAFAAVDMATGAATPYNPQFSGASWVNVIQRGSNNVIYVGGNFTTVNGYPQANLAALAFPPTFPVTALSFINPLANGTGGAVVWTAPQGGAAGYVVVAVEGTSAPTGVPQNGDVYTGSSVFTGAITAPFNGQVVYDGTATTFALSGLIPNTHYTLLAFPYNGVGASRVYFTESAAVTTLRTNPPPPPAVVVHPGILTVSSATLSFGDVALGSSRTRTYTMHCYNLTTASVRITPPAQCAVSVGGAAFTTSEFVFATRATIDSVQIRVRFSPTGNGAFSGIIQHVAGSTQATATLTGQSSPPSISTSTLSLNFGSVVPSSAATLAYRVNYRNLSTRSITLTPSAGYAVSTTGTEPFFSAPFTVPTAQSGRFNVFVKFSPSAVGVLGGSVKTTSPGVAGSPPDDPIGGGPTVIASGEGEYPLPGISATRLNFGDVPVGTCRTLSYTVFPDGGIRDQVTIICPQNAFSNVEISTNGPDGTFTSGCQAVTFSRIAGVSSVRVWVRFCPTTLGETLNFAINHLSQPGGQFVNLPLSGRSVGPEITVTPAAFNFGNVPVNQSESTTFTVRIRNAVPPSVITLSTDAVNTAFAFLQNSTGTWSGTWTTTATATNASFRVQARFTPTAVQTYRTTFAGVVVAQNGSSTDTFTLSGRGVGPTLTVTAGTLNFNGNFLLTPNTRSYVLRYDNITTNTVEISPTNNAAFLLSNAQNGVFTTTAGLSFTVGGTAANPVSGNVTAWIRFLAQTTAAVTVTLTHNSFVSLGIRGVAEEPLTLTGRGLAPMVNAIATGGTVRFERIPLGETRYQQYTLTYRNITAANITIDIPAGADIAITQNSSGTWTTAGQTLTIPTIAATTATTLIPLWIRFTPTQLQATPNFTLPIPHTSNGGDPRTTDTDNLGVVITRPPVILEAVPNAVNFGMVGLLRSSTSTYSLKYQNFSGAITFSFPAGVSGRLFAPTGMFRTNLTIVPPSFNGTTVIELQHSPTTNGNLVGSIVHTGGGTSATLQVRGRTTDVSILVPTPSPLAFTAVTTGTVLDGTIGQSQYVLTIGNNFSNRIRIRSLNTAVQIFAASNNVFTPMNQTGFSNDVEVQVMPSGSMATIPISVRARYSGITPLTATIRHEVLDANNAVLQTADLPVTIRFISCPGRTDTIAVLALYTEGARNYLTSRRRNIATILNDVNTYTPQVFTNSRLNNLVVKIVNPEGEFIPSREWGTADLALTMNALCNTPGNRLYTLRERLKADVVCVFNYQEGFLNANGTREDNYIPWAPPQVPNIAQSTMAVSVESEGNPQLLPPSPFSAMAEAIPYTVLHELGHLCGGDHNPGAGSGFGGSPFPDGQGLEYTGMRKIYTSLPPQTFYSGTIMYNGRGTGPATGNGERLPFWSDPTSQTNIRSEALVSGVIVTTSTPVILGSATQNMRRVMSITGPQMSRIYVASLNPIVNAPISIGAGQTARIDVTTCEGAEPFLFTWTAIQGIGGASVSGTVSNGGRTFEVVMPSGVSFIRVILTLRDANGVESVVERVIEEGTIVVLAEQKNSTESHSWSADNEQTQENSTFSSWLLEQNHPNPCSDETSITLGLPKGEHVRLSVHDALGREVMLAIDDRLRAGTHSFTLDIRHLPTGMYVYRLQAGAYRAAKKMSIVR